MKIETGVIHIELNHIPKLGDKLKFEDISSPALVRIK
jgi:hypothetical protein